MCLWPCLWMCLAGSDSSMVMRYVVFSSRMVVLVSVFISSVGVNMFSTRGR